MTFGFSHFQPVSLLFFLTVQSHFTNHCIHSQQPSDFEGEDWPVVPVKLSLCSRGWFDFAPFDDLIFERKKFFSKMLATILRNRRSTCR